MVGGKQRNIPTVVVFGVGSNICNAMSVNIKINQKQEGQSNNVC